MKIALVSQEYPPETARGGIGSQAFAKAQGLALLGHEIYVISRSTDQKRQVQVKNKVQVIRIVGMENKLPEMTEPVEWLTHSMMIAAEIEELHKRVKLDLVEFPEWSAEGYIYLLNRRAWNQIPVVIHLHGPMVMLAHTIGWPEKDSVFYKTGTEMEASCVRLADGVYSSSECSANWVRKYYDPGRTRIPVIHLGIDTEVFSPRPDSKNSNPTIVFVGRIVKNKGIEELIESFIHLTGEFPGLQLHIIGSGDANYVNQIKTEIINAGVDSRVNFSDYVQNENLSAELSKAHLFAAPSYYEGGPGFVYLEAMACGLPVIACSGSGVDEIITQGVNGMLVPPKDTLGLEHAIRRILKNKNLLKGMESNARRYALQNADRRKCIEKLDAYYQTIVQPNKVDKNVLVEVRSNYE